jgi:phytoene dehydrogenase-like protein
MAVMAKYFPYRLSGGRDWNALKDEVADGIVRIIGRHMPNLRELIVARQIMSAVDLERIFALPEGDVFHIRNDLDQIFSLRPHPKAARYRTPVQALYLCGAGVHPGGGITGGPGFNAAKRVLKDFRHLR